MCRSRKLRNRSGSSTTCSYSCREQERQIVFRPRTTLVGRSATGMTSSRLKLSPDDRQRHQHSRATAQFTWASGASPKSVISRKKARRRGAAILLLDESGLLMAPLVRRSWALRGQPPVLKQKARYREKVSVAAAVWLTPRRD